MDINNQNQVTNTKEADKENYFKELNVQISDNQVAEQQTEKANKNKITLKSTIRTFLILYTVSAIFILFIIVLGSQGVVSNAKGEIQLGLVANLILAIAIYSCFPSGAVTLLYVVIGKLVELVAKLKK